MSTAVAAAAEAPRATPAQLAENDLAPLFTLPCTNFSNASLSLHTGQAKVLLVFCPASFHGDETKGASMVLRKLQAQYERLQEAHVNVLAIVRELPSVAAQWADDLKLSFPILSDPNLEVSAQYVGTFDIGEYLLRAGVTPHLVGCITCRPAIVVVDNARVIRAVHVATKDNDEVDIDFSNLDLDAIIQSAIFLDEKLA